jgi:hypothetical protein
MANRFQRVRIDQIGDGTTDVMVGIGIEDDSAAPDANGDRPILTCLWPRCSAQHAHGWDTCDVATLANAREKDADGNDVPGTSVKERLAAQRDVILAKRAAAQAFSAPLPKRQVTKDGKEVDVEDKRLAV